MNQRALVVFTSLATIFTILPNGNAALEYDYSRYTNTTRVIPEDLFIYGIKNGCMQVEDFYRWRSEVRTPPYVYGLMVRNSNEKTENVDEKTDFSDFSAAFWCVPDNGNTDTFTLLFKFDGATGGMAVCEPEIEGQEFIGGLSVIRSLEEPLNWYYDVETGRKISSEEITAGPAVSSNYDGTGHIYYCHEGRWVARLVH